MDIFDNTIQDSKEAIIRAAALEEAGDYEGMYSVICRGLNMDCRNYELYYMLGFYYLRDNIDRAFLCFQNALFFCEDDKDREEISRTVDDILSSGNVSVKDTVIVIVSYNSEYMMQKCIESIRLTTDMDHVHIVVVDNASTDGVAEWLENQNDVTLVRNTENVGFSGACNQGVLKAEEEGWGECEVFLLNNDTRLPLNALFSLRMALYSGNKVGATGAISNYAGNEQRIEIDFEMPEEYVEFGEKINVPGEGFLEDRVRLSGFAMLIKGGLYSAVGGMDEDFSPGYFEDDDLCMKIGKAGYKLLLTRNAFIYHVGTQSFSKRNDLNSIILAHYELFCRKYGFDIIEYANADQKLIDQIPYDRYDAFNLLHVGCGLGAEIKEIRFRYPNANVVGVETNPVLREMAQKTDVIFGNVEEAVGILPASAINVLIIDPKMQGRLTDDEADMLSRVCIPQCVIIPRSPRCLYNPESIKLVIWDLDNTLWKGILSEEKVEHISENIDTIKKLTDAGVINSISSKNDASEATAELEKCGIADLLVFNNINWENKGEQIKAKIDAMHLRPENVLFVDDDIRNLDEAKHFASGIMTAFPDELDELIEFAEAVEKTDMSHKRLVEYQLLEKKSEASKEFENKADFLFDSNIKVSIFGDCIEEAQRIDELVRRTNQLNFTKNRESTEQLIYSFGNPNLKKGFVCASDKYGDYGVVGFFCFEPGNRKLKHFLFSCRIMGMGISECIYNYLGKPEIDVAEPVAVDLFKEMQTPWIELFEENESVISDFGERPLSDFSILLKGPCDMGALQNYISIGNIATEFNYVNRSGYICAGYNHSVNIFESTNMEKEEISRMIDDVPFVSNEDFETSIFEEEYQVICYSLLQDYHAGLYRRKGTDFFISFGMADFDLTNPVNWQGYIDGSIENHMFPFDKAILKNFSENWEFCGITSDEMLINNLRYFCNHVKGSPLFMLTLGSEVPFDNSDSGIASAKNHRRLNNLIREFSKDCSKIVLIDPSMYIQSRGDYGDSISHYSRKVYFDMATDIVNSI